MSTRRHLRYVREDNPDEAVLLALPWPPGTGRIPPPEITFYTSGAPVTYIYQGDTR